MNWDYIFDATDPRGVEYSATRRVANSTKAMQQNLQDMLDLQLAITPEELNAVKHRIRARQIEENKRREWGVSINFVGVITIICIFVWVLIR